MADNFFGKTDTGRLRDNNEDAFIAEKVNEQFVVGCVIDGVGGYEGGEIAAQIAKETIQEFFKKKVTDVAQTMKNALGAANQKIYNERVNNKDYESMACVLTLAVANVEGNEFHYAHIGDTRLYLFRDKSLVKVTKDHSFVGFLEDSKRLSEDEAMSHPKRNEINKALGFDPNMMQQADYIDAGRSPFLPGDLLLLCSDGLTDLVKSSTITSILSTTDSLEQKCAVLIDEANRAGGKDNITVVLVQNDKEPLKQRATKPKVIKKKDDQQEAEAVAEESKEKITPEVIKTRRRTALISLRLLCILMFGVIIWLLVDKYSKAPVSVATPPKKINPSEQKLLDVIHSAKDTVSLNDSLFRNGIIVNDTIHIIRDTLYIKGTGALIKSDTSYKGPAIVVDPSCKSLTLDSLTFENFHISIIAPAHVLHLRNVRFANGENSIMLQWQLANGKYINTGIRDSLFKIDSIPQKLK